MPLWILARSACLVAATNKRFFICAAKYFHLWCKIFQTARPLFQDFNCQLSPPGVRDNINDAELGELTRSSQCTNAHQRCNNVLNWGVIIIYNFKKDFIIHTCNLHDTHRHHTCLSQNVATNLTFPSEQACKLQATLEDCNPKLRLTHSLTGVKCRATRVA